MPIFPPSGGDASGNPVPGPSRVPESLGTGYLAKGWPALSINRAKRYVSPDGDDANQGDNFTRPLRYIKTAWLQLVEVGGGTLYVANNSEISADGKGLHVCGGETGSPTSVVPAAITMVGVGGVSEGQFNYESPITIQGGAFNGSDEQDDPCLWISDSIRWPMRFVNIEVGAGCNKPVRIGWDYPRDFDTFEIIKQPVTAAVRAASVAEDDGVPYSLTTLTVEPYEFNAVKIARADDVVYVTVDVGGIRVHEGADVYIDYVGDDFTPGWFKVIADVRVRPSGVADSITVASPGADFSAGDDHGPVIGTFSSTLVRRTDNITLYSTNSEFPSSQYKVHDFSEDTITVIDWYGYAPRGATASEVDIGTYAFQDRYQHLTAKLSIKNMTARPFISEATPEDFIPGPGFDIAGCEFFLFEDLFIDGFIRTDSGGFPGCRDPDRRAAVVSDCGPGASGTGFGTWRNLYLAFGGVRYHCSPNVGLITEFDTVCNDIPVGGGYSSVPAVEVLNGNNSHAIILRSISTVDTESSVPAIKVNRDAPWQCVTVDGVYGRVEGPCNVVYRGGANTSGSGETPNQNGQTGYYGADRRLAGMHASAARGGGPIAIPFDGQLISQDTSDWNIPSGVDADPCRGPFGGQSAIRLTNTNLTASTVLFIGRAVGDENTDGDIAIATGWFRGATGLGWAAEFSVIGDDTTYLLDRAYYPTSLGAGEEWNVQTIGGRLTGGATGSPTFTYSTTIQPGESVDVYCPQLLVKFTYEPDFADFSDAEVAEIKTHLQPAPKYLKAGIVGTREGQKLIGAAGIGTGLAYVEGISAGQLTIVGSFSPKKYEPVLKKDGTIKGWVELIDATINT